MDEYMEPCAGCGRTDLPLHTDRMCPECHVLEPDWQREHEVVTDQGGFRSVAERDAAYRTRPYPPPL